MNEEKVETTISGNGQTAESAPAAANEPTLEEQLTAAKVESAVNLDGWQRARAELANARKRFDKERLEAYPNAVADIAGKLLPALDDFERAMQNIPAEIADNKWFEGLRLVQRKLNATLEGFQVATIETVGHPFNPNWHEALMQEASEKYESGVIVRELQKGYRIGERIIRPALVVVAE